MKVKELIDILSDGRDLDAEVKLGMNRTRPMIASLRGVVQKSDSGPVFLLEDYDPIPFLTSDLWEDLDGPLSYK